MSRLLFFCRIQVKITTQKRVLQYFRVLVWRAQVILPSLIVVAITVLTTSSVADREDSAVPSFVVERGTAVLITKAKRAVSLPFVMDVSHDLA